MAILQSIQVGQPETREPVPGDTSQKPWRTGFYKRAVDGAINATSGGLAGDAVADTRVHGGPDKAICCYSADRFPYWRERLGEPEFGAAAFGENFTLAGLTEDDVCLGDRWRIGSAEFEVSQPRQPCWKLARRWRIKELTLWVQQVGYTGWYVRVVAEGDVFPGAEVELAGRTQPEWTIARANEVMYVGAEDRAANEALIAVKTLSESWKRQLRKRLN